MNIAAPANTHLTYTCADGFIFVVMTTSNMMNTTVVRFIVENRMHVLPLPALTDNYIWILYDQAGNALAVDPGESAPVEMALDAHDWRLQGILLTHHHPDHVGGALALRQRYDIPVYAPVDERIEATTHHVRGGDRIEFELPKARFRVMEVPGHTRSHVAYFGEGLLLSGDTLFSMGCGRLFEGTPEQMLDSLDRLAELPAETLLCCGHEYTATNGRFALTVEPHNQALHRRIADVDQVRAAHKPSLPVSLASELACNPFLRVPRSLDSHERVRRFAEMRSAKDAFRA